MMTDEWMLGYISATALIVAASVGVDDFLKRFDAVSLAWFSATAPRSDSISENP